MFQIKKDLFQTKVCFSKCFKQKKYFEMFQTEKRFFDVSGKKFFRCFKQKCFFFKRFRTKKYLGVLNKKSFLDVSDKSSFTSVPEKRNFLNSKQISFSLCFSQNKMFLKTFQAKGTF